MRDANCCHFPDGRVFHVATGSADSDDIRLPRRSVELVQFDLYEYLEQGFGLNTEFGQLYDEITAKSLASNKAPWPFNVHSFGRIGDALKQMEREPALGAYALEFNEEETVRFGYNPVEHKVELDANGVYIVVGGLGGLGLGVAEWLVHKGAGHVVLVSRSGLPNGIEPEKRYEQLCESLKAEVQAYQLDICNPAEVAIFSERLQSKGRKIRGVVHAAGLLRVSIPPLCYAFTSFFFPGGGGGLSY